MFMLCNILTEIVLLLISNRKNILVYNKIFKIHGRILTSSEKCDITTQWFSIQYYYLKHY